MVKLLEEAAPAKINLFLRVTGRRADGYHELDSIFVPISICDRVQIELRPAGAASVQLLCDSQTIPGDERNLAFRAARDFLGEFGIKADVLVRLHKEIPASAGLGGGSSDAGAVLRIMAELCSIDRSALAAVAMRIGADVPFFLNPVPCRVRGIGERAEPLGEITKPFLVIAAPSVEVSTASVFRDLRPEHWSGPAPNRHVQAIVQGSIERSYLVNDLERVAIPKWPQIGELKGLLEVLGARGAAMTGSGGAVFGIFDSSEQAFQACQQIAHRASQVEAFTASVL